MKGVRILADDLTGALDCAAAFGAGVPVHLNAVSGDHRPAIEIVSTGTRDVEVSDLPSLLSPSLAWLKDAQIAFKKVDSLLRGNTFEEVDWLARQGEFKGLAFVPAFPAQGRVTEGGQQWWVQSDGQKVAVAASIQDILVAKGWTVERGSVPPVFNAAQNSARLAWLPDVRSDEDMQAVAQCALKGSTQVLWCGSAGLAQALALDMPQLVRQVPFEKSILQEGPLMLVSASHHAVTSSQWHALNQSKWAAQCRRAHAVPQVLDAPISEFPALLDLSASTPLAVEEASALLDQQAHKIARNAPRPRALVVVGGDTLLALCKALGATGLESDTPLARPGWGCARMLGGRWDGLTCHTRSGAFGNANDLLEVINSLSASS